jgi:WD40 repeat protein
MGFGNDRLLAWRTTDGLPLWSHQLPADSEWATIPSIAVSGDGKRVAAGSRVFDDSGVLAGSGRILVLDAGTGEAILDLPEQCGPVALDATGARMAHLSPNGHIQVRDVDTGRVLADRATPVAPVWWLRFSADGSAMLAASPRPGDSHSGVLVKTHPIDGNQDDEHLVVTPGEVGTEDQLIFRPDGPWIFTRSRNQVALFDADGHLRWSHPDREMVGNFSPDGRVLVTLDFSWNVHAWFLDAL